MSILRMTDLDLRNKRVVIREDFNVPIQEGKITSDSRIRAALPTIELAMKQNAAVILLSHLGRPAEGKFTKADSLQPVAERLSALLKTEVPLIRHWVNGVTVNPGEVVLCENVRFELGEGKNDPVLAKKMAALGDVFVMDAFATAHRAQASTYGIAEFAKVAAGGPLLMKELDALGRALALPEHPFVALVGGSKVSTKLSILESLSEKVDQLIVAGGIANTFLAAAGFEIGKSLYEPDLLETARHLMQKLQKAGKECPLPVDVVVATEFSKTAKATIKNITDIHADDMILDIGPESAGNLSHILTNAKTIVWNGPVGVFEFPQFAKGTEAISHAIANSSAFSLAGGGDTISAIETFGIKNKISYISTAGGAFLEFLEGKTLPAVAILQQRGKEEHH